MHAVSGEPEREIGTKFKGEVSGFLPFSQGKIPSGKGKVIEAENIALWTEGQISEVRGETQLESISGKFKNQGNIKIQEAAALFIFIPNQAVTQWQPQAIEEDSKNFICTRTGLKLNPEFKNYGNWKVILNYWKQVFLVFCIS